MDGAGPDEGRKRRLPLWMLGVASTDQVRRSENRDENNNLEDGVKPLDFQPEAKARIVQPVEVLLNDNVPLEVNSCFLTKCETKRRKRKPGRCDGDCDGNIPEIGFERRMYNGLGRTVQESEPLKRRKATCFRSGSSEESKIPSPSEEDGELTMEDLMSIAEEVVCFSLLLKEEKITFVLIFLILEILVLSLFTVISIYKHNIKVCSTKSYLVTPSGKSYFALS